VAILPEKLPLRQVHAISRAIADPQRYDILSRIARQKIACPCTDLRASFAITPATLSHHIRELESAGLVETTRRGKFVDVSFCEEIWAAYLVTLAGI
jgi:DNA-binding transcriptional ArsR family regulator